ncbi:MAG: hypothetical protein DRJ42_24855 [Deltaproteobacteria bacterium]|nr:MAG: hypothetical protein DRJ42_24855 [Deltaproteobacteria bacterium]
MAATTVAKRTQSIDRILSELMSLRGVTSAALVDADGFVTHIRKDFEIDSDALGAAVQIMFGAATRSAQHVQQESTNMVVSENREGLMMVAPLAAGFTLALVADKNAMLGSIRFEVKETLPVLSRILGESASARG